MCFMLLISIVYKTCTYTDYNSKKQRLIFELSCFVINRLLYVIFAYEYDVNSIGMIIFA